MPVPMLLLLCTLFSLSLSSPSDHWAVLIVGSTGYNNYRHLADICHAQQILRTNGFLPSQIITMSQNNESDFSRLNPFPGQLFNQPDGRDVYEGCEFDYWKHSMTVEFLMAVLKGDEEAIYQKSNTGKVLKTDENSKVFIYYADHGAPGFVYLSHGQILYADELVETIKYMYDQKLYGELVFYLEACDSGSMFEGLLPDNINAYAITGANSSQLSWATYCSPYDVVNGTELGTCLGSLFSVSWMENSDVRDAAKETVGQQYLLAKVETNLSEVSEFGDKGLKQFAIGKYQGVLDLEEEEKPAELFNRLLRNANQRQELKQSDQSLIKKRVLSAQSSRDTTLHYLYNRLRKTSSKEAQLDLMDELASRIKADRVFEKFVGRPLEEIQETILPKNFSCLKRLVREYEENCGWFTDYSLKHSKHFVAACEVDGVDVEELVQKIAEACSI